MQQENFDETAWDSRGEDFQTFDHSAKNHSIVVQTKDGPGIQRNMMHKSNFDRSNFPECTEKIKRGKVEIYRDSSKNLPLKTLYWTTVYNARGKKYRKSSKQWNKAAASGILKNPNETLPQISGDKWVVRAKLGRCGSVIAYCRWLVTLFEPRWNNGERVCLCWT